MSPAKYCVMKWFALLMIKPTSRKRNGDREGQKNSWFSGKQTSVNYRHVSLLANGPSRVAALPRASCVTFADLEESIRYPIKINKHQEKRNKEWYPLPAKWHTGRALFGRRSVSVPLRVPIVCLWRGICGWICKVDCFLLY